jgi:hypothetical protein
MLSGCLVVAAPCLMVVHWLLPMLDSGLMVVATCLVIVANA